MSDSRHPEAPQPLSYQPQAPRRGAWRNVLLGVATGLLLFLLVAALLSSVQRQRAQQQMLVAERMLRQAQLDHQAQQLAAIQQQAAQPDVPAEGIRATIQQRQSWWYGKRLKLAIGDITGGQVSLEITDGDGKALLPVTQVRRGDVLRLSQGDRAPLRLELIELTNNLIGEDYATFEIRPDPPPATQTATRPVLSEAVKIERLLAQVRNAQGIIFIRNGQEHSAEAAADHLAMKWDIAGGADDPQATAELFIEAVGTRSSTSGQEYRVRLPDGRELASAQWLRQQLREIEQPQPAATTRRASPPPPPLHGHPREAAMLQQPDCWCCGAASFKPMNLAFPTLGGKQFWTDQRIDPSGWRIQQHAVTGHYRLLDARNVRRAWGSLGDCQDAWAQLAPMVGPDARKGRELVVLLHGLGRTRSAMAPMAAFFRDAGYDVISFGYASTRAPITDHAAALAAVLSSLGGYDRVHFVGHSLGAMVVRRLLAMAPEIQTPPVGRVVMLAPPNNGSMLASRLRSNPVFMIAAGPSAQEIAQWGDLEPRLATPRECGVIAGDYRSLANPLLDQEGDLIVTVEETKLAGMKDFLAIDATHTFLMRNPEVMNQTLKFLRDGRFSHD